MIIVGKSMPIDNYEQYKRVINQITGRLYMHIRKTNCLFFVFCFCVCVCFGMCMVIYNDLLLIHL